MCGPSTAARAPTARNALLHAVAGRPRAEAQPQRECARSCVIAIAMGMSPSPTCLSNTGIWGTSCRDCLCCVTLHTRVGRCNACHPCPPTLSLTRQHAFWYMHWMGSPACWVTTTVCRVCALTGAARGASLLHELCNIHARLTRDAWQAAPLPHNKCGLS